MNPTQVENNDHKIVRFTNKADFDFTAEMGAMYGGVPYFVPAGESLLVPKTIGLHLAKHLARQVFIKKAPIRDESQIDGKGSDRPLWDDQALADMQARFLTDEYAEQKPAVMTEAQAIAEKVKTLNDTFKDESESNPESSNSPESDVTPKQYSDKAEVIAELEKRGIAHDKRKSKNTLEQLLK